MVGHHLGGTEIEKSGVLRSLDAAASWGEEHNRPLYLGEFGAYGKADIDSRARWTSFVAREAKKRDMSWAYWEFGAGFGVYVRARREGNGLLLDALLSQDQHP
jgi:endoglucanase